MERAQDYLFHIWNDAKYVCNEWKISGFEEKKKIAWRSFLQAKFIGIQQVVRRIKKITFQCDLKFEHRLQLFFHFQLTMRELRLSFLPKSTAVCTKCQSFFANTNLGFTQIRKETQSMSSIMNAVNESFQIEILLSF